MHDSDPESRPPADGLGGGHVTALVRRWSDGDDGAFHQLIELVYDDQRRIAHHHLKLGGHRGSVSTTELVHEAYLKLARVEGGGWESRGQFFAFCSRAMRHILIDFARRRQALKRGGDAGSAPFDEDMAAVDAEVVRILEVEDALRRLEVQNERMARIVECRFFGGLTVADTAEAVGISRRTVEREWARARAYLYLALGS